MLHLEAVDHGRQLAEDLVRLLMELELRGHEVGEVAERLRRVEHLFDSGHRQRHITLTLSFVSRPTTIFKNLLGSLKKATTQGRAQSPCKKSERIKTHIFHNPDRLLSLRDELVLLVLELGPRLLAVPCLAPRLHPPLDGIQTEPGVLHGAARARREHDISIERGAPSGQEPRLDLVVLREPGLAHALLGERVLLQPGGQRVLGGAGPGGGGVERLGARERGAGQRVVERLGLRLGRGGSGEGGLGLGGRGGGGEELDFLRDGAAQVVEGLGYVGRVVVGFLGVLGSVFLEAGECQSEYSSLPMGEEVPCDPV